MNRFVAVAVVVIAMPFVVGLARASLRPEPVAVVKVPRELAAMAEPVALGRRYGLAVVAMPEPPNMDSRASIADGRSPMADTRLPNADGRSPNADSRVPIADGRSPMADDRAPVFACPDIRAIVSGDSPFAIIAWDDQSIVINRGQTIATPAGPVTVGRIRSNSIAFAQADTALQCKLPVR